MSRGSQRLELKAISSGRVGDDGITINASTSPESIFKDENYRGGWVHDKADRKAKRVPWSAETGRAKQSAGVVAFVLLVLLNV